MQRFNSLISDFEQCLKFYCQPMYDRLLPPLEQAEVAKYFNRLGIIDPLVFALYSWRNGIPNNGDISTNAFRLSPFGVFAPLSDVLEFQELGIKEECWNKSLIPIVASYAGDFLLFESLTESEKYGMLFLYSPNLGYVSDIVTYYDSVEAMLLTVIECFKEGAFTYLDLKSGFNVDWDKYFEISTKNNPYSDYWKEG